MFPQEHSQVDTIEFLKELTYLMEGYLNDRSTSIINRERKIAALQAACEELEHRTELLKQISNQFFNERRKIRELSMQVLDRAIEMGDSNISEHALWLLNNEYSKDFFGMMNKLGGIT